VSSPSPSGRTEARSYARGVTRALVAPVAALVLLVAGCGGDDSQSTVTGEEPVTVDASVYWLRDGKVWPALRDVEVGDLNATAILEELLAGPTEQETADLAVTTAIPEGTEVEDLEISGAIARVELSAELPEEGLAQVVYTLTTSLFPAVASVEIQGKTYKRADFEDLTPAILVESPLAFEDVTSPLRVTGTANTFEATFSYELTDTDGLIVDENFVTATSGTGTRGTFDFTTKPYAVPFDGVGALIVFERSAKDGSRINLVEIPLRMTR
jgi:Immunoglobulin-like domain of bacterial spore germination/Sporulation and spore germination